MVGEDVVEDQPATKALPRMVPLPGAGEVVEFKSRRRTHTQNREMESVFMDGVDMCRQDLFELLRQDWNSRRAQDEEVSSSDEERDSCRVEEQLLRSHEEPMPSLMQRRSDRLEGESEHAEAGNTADVTDVEISLVAPTVKFGSSSLTIPIRDSQHSGKECV